MQALTISAHGTLDQLEYRTDLPIPTAAEGQVRVKILAAALNHLDLFVVKGLPGVTITPPWIMGGDAVGLIEETDELVIINPGVSDGTCEYCQIGEHSLCVKFALLGEHLPGTIAEYITVPKQNIAKIPRTTPIDQAAAFTLATLTAWRMVVTKANVQQDDHVLIQGIGGGVALAALQIAKQRGAQVWVTSTSDEKLERAAALGADHLINSTKTDVAKAIRTQTAKRGVTVVIDSVGEATWQSSLGALGKAGRLVTCGGTSGPMLQTDVRRLFWNQWNIMGSTMGNASEFQAIAEELAQGRLLPPIDQVFPIQEGKAAFERLASQNQFGKVVIRVADA